MTSAAPELSAERSLFDENETCLIDRAFAALTPVAPGDAATLRSLMSRIGELGRLIESMPPLREPQSLGGQYRDGSTLIEHLCHSDGLSGDLDLPVKATLSRTLLVSKIHFFAAFVRATSSLTTQGGGFRSLTFELREELAQAIYTHLAEELLLALLRKPDVKEPIKREAADQLIVVWDNAELEIDDFCPMLESTWHARNRIAADLGSLLGTTEYFRLVCEDCAPQFLDFFARDEVSTCEKQAFEEFLFGMTYEELTSLRRAMREQGLDAVTVDWAGKVLNRRIEHECHVDEIDPMSLYRSYFRRQLAADFRIMAGAEGPRRTAEAYLMIYLLNQKASDRNGVRQVRDEYG